MFKSKYYMYMFYVIKGEMKLFDSSFALHMF